MRIDTSFGGSRGASAPLFRVKSGSLFLRMRLPEHYYIGALKRAIEGDLDGAFAYQEKGQDAKEFFGLEFAEAASEDLPYIEEAVDTLLGSLDFTRCVRPNGTVYGTKGKCRQGTEQAKTETAKSPSKRASRLEKELPRTGGRFQVPGRMAQETDEQNQAAKDRVKKRLAAEEARKERIQALDETTSKMANELFGSRGRVSDGSLRAKNGLANIKEDLERAHSAGRGAKTTKLIEGGDLKGLLRHAEEVTSRGKSEHVKARVEEQKQKQKEEMREMLAAARARGDSKEEIDKSTRDAKFYAKRDLERAKVQADEEYNALYRILRG